MIIDISTPVTSSMMVYKDRDEKRPTFTKLYQHPLHPIQETELTINLHTGTHVDAPLHIIPDGPPIDEFALSKFYGPAVVIDLTNVIESIRKSDLESITIPPDSIVLLKTRNSMHLGERFDFDFVYLSDEAAAYLVSKQIKTIGIDSLGIERNQSHHPTHRHLLNNGIPIIEGLNLRTISPGAYTFIGFPLSLPGMEASLMRAVLITQ